MNVRHFSSISPGSLCRIDTPLGHDYAFTPVVLPAGWTFDPSLWRLLCDASAALGTLNGIGQTLADPQLLLRPLQNREAITSSNMEGTFVTPEQLFLYGLDSSRPGESPEKREDWIEVMNYGRAMQKGIAMLETYPICNRVIKEMHLALMQGVRGKNKLPGEFRRKQVQLGSNGRFVPPPTIEVPRLMADLERFINTPDETIDPLVRCFMVHYQFETIHPFEDGNGRVGRALMALMIQKCLGHTHPWLYMSAFFDQHKDEYVGGLYGVSTRGDWRGWVEFCLRGAVIQAKDAIDRCHRFNQLRADFHARATSPSPRTHRVIEGLFASPILTIPSLAESLSVTYPTAKADVDRLIGVGVLAELPGGHPKAYYCREIMQIAYRDGLDRGVSDSPPVAHPAPPSSAAPTMPEATIAIDPTERSLSDRGHTPQ